MLSFDEMSLPTPLQKALKELNFVTPTPIQAEVIPTAIQNRDVMACAETGSGKTAAYAIPMAIRLIENPKTHALILAPTRELAQQIADFCRSLTKFTPTISVTTLIGGADIFKQFRSLKKNPRIIVATPGRLNDHLNRKSVKLNSTHILILDEGDRMLDMGFAPQLDEILKFLPSERHTSLFTATLPEKVKRLAEKYLTKPEQINVGRISLPVASINQSILEVTNKEKDDKLVDELNKRENSIIVFAKTKVRTDKLAKVLNSYGFKVDLIHGGRTQGQRNRAIKNFRDGSCRILCATDVAARGIDIPQVAHVINYDLPMMTEDYVHRIGRTARNGASGEALSFVTPEERRNWNIIAKKYKIPNMEIKMANKSDRNSSRKQSKFSKDKKSSRTYETRSKDFDFEPRKPREKSSDKNSFGFKKKKSPSRFSKSEETSFENKKSSFKFSKESNSRFKKKKTTNRFEKNKDFDSKFEHKSDGDTKKKFTKNSSAKKFSFKKTGKKFGGTKKSGGSFNGSQRTSNRSKTKSYSKSY